MGTQTIGSTEVTFKPQGELSVKPPMQGLRWRLDAGPTHLDTCTFQVLSDDGAILQYTVGLPCGSANSLRLIPVLFYLIYLAMLHSTSGIRRSRVEVRGSGIQAVGIDAWRHQLSNERRRG